MTTKTTRTKALRTAWLPMVAVMMTVAPGAQAQHAQDHHSQDKHAQDKQAQDHHAGVMTRGAHVMGFDQAATTHHFRLAKTGGAIEVTANDAADAKAIAQIQSHLRHIAVMFGEGNFNSPMLIHAQEPPGVAEMKRAGAAIGYTYESLPRGGRVVVHTDSHVKAVHDFLRFQITDHRTGDPLDVPRQ